MADEAAVPPQETPGPDGPFARLVGVFVSPVRTFAAIARRPTWLVPFLLWVSVFFLLGQIVTTRMDLRKTIQENAERHGQPITEAQIDAGVESSRRFAWMFEMFWALLPGLISVVAAGCLWMACQAFGWELKFQQSFAVTVHAFLPGILLSVVLLGMLWNRQTIDPQTVGDILPIHLGVFVNARSQKTLHSLLSSIDLTSLWSFFLLVIGLSAATKAPRGRMAVLVLSLWSLFVLGRAGLVAIFA